MTEFNLIASLPEMSGINVADKPDSLLLRGNQELADLRNLDFYGRGVQATYEEFEVSCKSDWPVRDWCCLRS